MTKRGVTIFLCAYFALAAAAVVIRFDRFPWTWVPMYSVYQPKEVVTVPVRDRGDLIRGLAVVRRDGSTGWVGYDDLNIPWRNWWRIYLNRINMRGPPKYRQARANLSSANRWIRGLDPHAEPVIDPTPWDRRLLTSLNRSLGLTPSDPKFIVAARAERTELTINKRTLELIAEERVAPEIIWNPAWGAEWEARR